MHQLEKAQASIRAKVEHLFPAIKSPFHHTKVRYRGLQKNTEQFKDVVYAERFVDGAPPAAAGGIDASATRLMTGHDVAGRLWVGQLCVHDFK